MLPFCRKVIYPLTHRLICRLYQGVTAVFFYAWPNIQITLYLYSKDRTAGFCSYDEPQE